MEEPGRMLRTMNKPAEKHSLNFRQRTEGTVTGVIDIVEFDNTQIRLSTNMGHLLIRGRNLHVKRLNLEKGEADVEGTVDSLSYQDKKENTGKKHWLFG